MSKTEFILPSLPAGKEFEEYIAAFLQASGYYIEKNVIERQESEILELDVIFTNYNQRYPVVRIVEVKSGDWAFTDIFKIKGWMEYVGLRRGYLIVKKNKDNLDFYKNIAKKLGIEILIEDLSDSKKVFSIYNISKFEILDIDVENWRYSYWLERMFLKQLKKLKKDNLELKCYIEIDKYHYKVQSGIFFTPNIIDRIKILYDAFREHPLITAKSSNEIVGGCFDDKNTTIPTEMYKEAFYNCKLNIVQFSTYVEHLARLKILKNAIDYYLYKKSDVKYRTDDAMQIFDIDISKLDFLPSEFLKNLETISQHKYYKRYPLFWQWFLWVFGGFVLLDYEKEEYELFSRKSGLPIEEIPNALKAYDILFPMEKSWLVDLPKSNIKIMHLFPVPFRGIGANYRREYYTKNKRFEDLALTGSYTLHDLLNWNNAAVEVLGLFE